MCVCVCLCVSVCVCVSVCSCGPHGSKPGSGEVGFIGDVLLVFRNFFLVKPPESALYKMVCCCCLLLFGLSVPLSPSRHFDSVFRS